MEKYLNMLEPSQEQEICDEENIRFISSLGLFWCSKGNLCSFWQWEKIQNV